MSESSWLDLRTAFPISLCGSHALGLSTIFDSEPYLSSATLSCFYLAILHICWVLSVSLCLFLLLLFTLIVRVCLFNLFSLVFIKRLPPFHLTPSQFQCWLYVWVEACDVLYASRLLAVRNSLSDQTLAWKYDWAKGRQRRRGAFSLRVWNARRSYATLMNKSYITKWCNTITAWYCSQGEKKKRMRNDLSQRFTCPPLDSALLKPNQTSKLSCSRAKAG